MIRTPAWQFPILWDPQDFTLQPWEGQTEGVYQRPGDLVLENQIVDLEFTRAFVTQAWEPDARGLPLAHFEYAGRSHRAVTRHADATVLHFDFAKTIEGALFERYRRERRPLGTYFPLPYHCLVPRCVRRPIKRVGSSLRGGSRPGSFPEWPITASLLELMRLLPQNRKSESWPDHRAFAFVLTHDVESRAGVKLAEELAKVEADHEVRSTWFIAGRLAGEARKLADRLKGEGHEIGLHGVEHDMVFPFLSQAGMEKRLESCRHFIDDYGIRGFRSPALLKSDLMYEVLGEWFAYDSSAVDTGRLSPHARPTGCCSIFPFRRGKLVVVPITLPLDSSLLFLGYGLGDMPGLWHAKAAFIRAFGGAAVLATHPEPHFSGNKQGLEAYASFLESAEQLSRRWTATMGELVDCLEQLGQATHT